MSTIVAFGENAAFYTNSPSNRSYWRNLSSGLQRVLNGKGHRYFWVSMGPSGQYYISWRREDGKEFYELGDDSGRYKNLDSKLDSISSLKSAKVIFGADEGKWFMLTGTGGYRSNGLNSTGISSAIDDNEANVKHVTLGADDSWIVLFDDGSTAFELENNYGSLQSILEDASDGDIKSVFLNPFNSSQYVVGYKNGGKSSHMPTTWYDNVKF